MPATFAVLVVVMVTLAAMFALGVHENVTQRVVLPSLPLRGLIYDALELSIDKP